MRSPVSRMAAAVIFVVALGGVALWFHGSGATYALADFIQPLLDAKKMRYKETVSGIMIKPEGQSPFTYSSKILVLRQQACGHTIAGP